GIRDRNVTGVQTCALPILRICMFLNKWERPRHLWLMAVFLRLKNDRWAISSLLLVIILLIICFTAGYLAPFPDSFCGSFMSPPEIGRASCRVECSLRLGVA